MLKITTNPKQFEDFSKDYDLIKLAVDYVSLKKGKIIFNRLLESSSKYLNLNIDTDDIVINNAQKLANKIGNNLKKLSDSTVIYATKVEPAYLVLEKQLDAFKKTEDDYKELCTDGPILNDDTKDDRVYEIDFINENPYMNEKVIINWQNLIQEY